MANRFYINRFEFLEVKLNKKNLKRIEVLLLYFHFFAKNP